MDTAESSATSDGHRYSERQCGEIMDDLQRRRDEIAGVRVNIAHLAEQLTVNRAKTFAHEGIGRRLRVIDRCIKNVFSIYPPGRTEFLSEDEIEDIGIQLHAFAINVYAVLDNVAWVCMLEAGGNLSPLKVGLFKSECAQYLPQRLVTYLQRDTITRWFKEYGKVYRDSTAHRIPPYLPPRAFTPDDGAKWRQLDQQAHAALLESVELLRGPSRHQVRAVHQRYEDLLEQRDRLGHNSILMALSLSGEDASSPVYLHPQMICDLATIGEVVTEFATAMRDSRGWLNPSLPDLRAS